MLKRFSFQSLCLLFFALFFPLTAIAAPEIILVQNLGVFRSPNDGSSSQVVLPAVNGLNSVAVDTTNSKMLWVDIEYSVIWRSNLDASDVEILVNSSLTDSAYNVAVDNTNGKIFWTTDIGGEIVSANLDGSGATAIITGLDSTRALALDPVTQKVYWSDAINSKILRANYDGSGSEELITTDASSIENIALDLTNSKFYWWDTNNTRIKQANLDGTGVIEVLPGVPSVRGIAVDSIAEKIVWTDSANGKVRRANLDGSAASDIVSGLGQPYGLIFDPTLNKIYWVDSVNETISHADTDGSDLEIDLAGMQFSDVAYDADSDLLYAAGSGQIRAYTLSTLTYSVIVSGENEVSSIALDLTNGKIYWSNNSDDLIRRANLDGTGVQTIISGSTTRVGQMRVSDTDSKLYFTDIEGSGIFKANLDGTSLQLLLAPTVPVGLALDYDNNKMYFTDVAVPSVSVSELDGSNALALVTSGITTPSVLQLDRVNGKIYWSDLTAGTISRANLNGTSSEVVVSGAGGVSFFTLLEDTVFSISGSVSFANLTGDSLEGVLVSDGTRQTTTDSNGNFTLSGVPDGSYTLTFTKTGYAFSGNTAVTVNGNNVSAVAISAEPGLPTSVYTFWNGFLGMTNVLELYNYGSSTATVDVTLYDTLGQAATGPLSTRTFTIPANQQFDVILNELSGFSADNYGILKVDIGTQQVDGHVVFYRSRSLGVDFDYAYALPLHNPLTGTSQTIFNTYYPNSAGTDTAVFQWLTIANLSTTTAKSFTVNRYDHSGALLGSRNVTVPALGRVDIDGGYADPGPNNVGINEIVPGDVTSPYLAKLVRYGMADDRLKFAVPQLAAAQSSAVQYVSISRGAGATNWLEVANMTASLQNATVEFYSNSGSLLQTENVQLAAHAQAHLFPTALLSTDESGYAKISATSADSILGQSVYYYSHPVTAEVTEATLMPSSDCYGTEIVGSYNLFLNLSNWLRVKNVSSSSKTITLNVYNEAGDSTEVVRTLGAHQGLDLGLHELATYGTALNTYSQFSISTSTAGSICADIVRVRNDSDDGVDLAVTTPVR